MDFTITFTVYLDFVYNLVFLKKRFGYWICFHPMVWGWGVPTSLGPLAKANCVQRLSLCLYNEPNWVCTPISSPEDGNRSNFQNVVFFQEYRTMDRLQKSSRANINFCKYFKLSKQKPVSRVSKLQTCAVLYTCKCFLLKYKHFLHSC